MDLVDLGAGGSKLQLAPDAGGAVVRYWRERAGAPREWLRPTSAEALRSGDRYDVAAFPLVPYLKHGMDRTQHVMSQDEA